MGFSPKFGTTGFLLMGMSFGEQPDIIKFFNTSTSTDNNFILQKHESRRHCLFDDLKQQDQY